MEINQVLLIAIFLMLIVMFIREMKAIFKENSYKYPQEELLDLMPKTQAYSQKKAFTKRDKNEKRKPVVHTDESEWLKENHS